MGTQVTTVGAVMVQSFRRAAVAEQKMGAVRLNGGNGVEIGVAAFGIGHGDVSVVLQEKKGGMRNIAKKMKEYYANQSFIEVRRFLWLADLNYDHTRSHLL